MAGLHVAGLSVLRLCRLKLCRQFLSPMCIKFSDMASFNVISFRDLKEQLEKKNVILIDVREPQELKDFGKIPGSVNIPVGKIEESFALPPETFQKRYNTPKPEPNDSNLVFSCRSGPRAETAMRKLLPLGYSNAKVYSGSFMEWLELGGPVEKS